MRWQFVVVPPENVHFYEKPIGPEQRFYVIPASIWTKFTYGGWLDAAD